MIDGFLRVVAPSIAASRAEARLRLDMAEQRRAIVMKAYDAARTGGRHSGWNRTGASANETLRASLAVLRNGARSLVRNNPHASRAVRVISAHVAGTGVRPRAMVDDLGLQSRAADQWNRFVENCCPEHREDFHGQQRLMMRCVAEGGEALRLWRPIEDRGRLFWRTCILEGDYLDHNRNEVTRDGNRIIQGVEFDAMGVRVAYWLFETHPGDTIGGSLFGQSRRVPAEFVDHAFERLRPGQVRGVSWLAPVALTIADVGDLAEAEVVRKKLEACIAAVITNATDVTAGAAIAGLSDDAGNEVKDAAGNPIERLKPGMILQAPIGWDMKFHAPTSSDGLVDHMKERLHAIAAGIGTTYSQMTGDQTESNYSADRAATLEFWRLVDTWQDDLMVMQTGRPAWRRVMDAAVVNGEIPARPPAKWARPRRPWVDPQKDFTARLGAVAAGFESPEELIEASGSTVEEVIAGLVRWRDMLAAAGLKTTVDLGEPTEGTDDDGA